MIANPHFLRPVRNARESSDGAAARKPQLEKFSQSIRLAYSNYTFPKSLRASDGHKVNTHAGAPAGNWLLPRRVDL
jgi:hypothetical protein